MYALSPLVRAGISRRDATWMAERLAGDLRVLPVAGQRNLIVADDTPRAVVLRDDHARAAIDMAAELPLVHLCSIGEGAGIPRSSIKPSTRSM